jgi:hypothetical protein
MENAFICLSVCIPHGQWIHFWRVLNKFILFPKAAGSALKVSLAIYKRFNDLRLFLKVQSILFVPQEYTQQYDGSIKANPTVVGGIP